MKTLLITILLGYLATASVADAQPTDQERSQIFPKADYCRQTGALDGGYFCEAWRTGRDGESDKLLGYILINTLDYRSAEMRALVAISLVNGEIVKLLVNGPEIIEQEFLEQFEGKNLDSKFEIAKTLDDLLVVPAKIKAISGKVEISEEIAKAVSALMKSALNSPKLTFAK